MEWRFHFPIRNYDFNCASGYPRHVGRNYVPLFDVDTDLRYYVIRDVIDI